MLNAWDQHFQAAHTTASRGHRLGIVGGSDTNHKVVGVGDFFGDAAADILYRDNATGDTWFADMSNGALSTGTRSAASLDEHSVAATAPRRARLRSWPG
jgi:hypothetical protein